MYLLKSDCCFAHGNVSFSIPKDYYFYPDEADYLRCMPRGKRFKVYYDLCYEDISIKQAIKNYQRDTYETSAPIYPIEHNGLKGYCSTFRDVQDEVFTAVFSIVDRKEGHNRFKFTISTTKFNIAKLKATPAFLKLWNSIEKTTREQDKTTKKRN